MITGIRSKYVKRFICFSLIVVLVCSVFSGCSTINDFTDYSQKENWAYYEEDIADAKAAFEYYIKHVNNGKPINVAGFSQGANNYPIRGSLKVTDVTPADYPAVLDIFKDGIYHLYDYQLFYKNIQENVTNRLNEYLSHKKYNGE